MGISAVELLAEAGLYYCDKCINDSVKGEETK